MDKEQIIQMARDAGAYVYAETICLDGKDIHDFVERFAAAIRAVTKEEDAKICENEYHRSGEDLEYGGCMVAADAIRASK